MIIDIFVLLVSDFPRLAVFEKNLQLATNLFIFEGLEFLMNCFTIEYHEGLQIYHLFTAGSWCLYYCLIAQFHRGLRPEVLK